LNLFEVRYTSEYRISCAIRSLKTWDVQETKIPRYAVLAIDEIGLSSQREVDRMLLYQVINARYENALPTIAISNLEFQEFSNYCGPRVMDRLKEGHGKILAFDWPSFRK
jgi:DNA replication protein DnaC